MSLIYIGQTSRPGRPSAPSLLMKGHTYELNSYLWPFFVGKMSEEHNSQNTKKKTLNMFFILMNNGIENYSLSFFIYFFFHVFHFCNKKKRKES